MDLEERDPVDCRPVSEKEKEKSETNARATHPPAGTFDHGARVRAPVPSPSRDKRKDEERTISSGDRTPKCTRVTRRSSAVECGNLS